MTDNASAPDTGPENSPTAPLPNQADAPAPPLTPGNESVVEPYAAAVSQPQPTEPFPATWVPPAEQPAPSATDAVGPIAAPGGPHRTEPGAVIAIVAGALLVIVLAFGGGWMARSAYDHTHLLGARGFMTNGQVPNGAQRGQGFGRRFGGGMGGQNMGQGMPGYPGSGFGRGRGMYGWGQSPSQPPTRTAPSQLPPSQLN
jgi:hypothetical protein